MNSMPSIAIQRLNHPRPNTAPGCSVVLTILTKNGQLRSHGKNYRTTASLELH